MSRLHHARKRLREALGSGFAALLLALGLAVLGPVAALAQPPGPPPPGGVAPAPPGGGPPPPGSGAHQVCVYALVILASNQPAGAPPGPGRPLPPPQGVSPGAPPSPGSTPTPDVKKGDDQAGPPPSGGGCGQPMRVRLWAARLQQVFGYSSYEPISAFETVMPLRLSQRFALPGGRELEIEPLNIRGDIVWLSVKIKRGGVAEIATVLSVPPRGPALIGGPPYGPGVLIIALRSRVAP